MSRADSIYLDYAAATPISAEVFAAMVPYFSEEFYNPSSPYLPAKRVHEAYEEAKDQLAHTIGAKGNDIIITAGATESINLAFTVLKNFENPHTLILATEHPAVRATAAHYGDYAEIKVDKNGFINLADFKSKITDDTVLVSISLANNEFGTIQPLAEISQIIRDVKQDRLSRKIKTPLYLHSDASQAGILVDIKVARLGVDMLTINSAKVYGPKGIGALYVGHDVRLHPIIYGGGQEMGLRSGTENVPALIGFAKAATLAKDHLTSARKNYESLRKLFKEELKNACKIEPEFLGSEKHQLANFCPVSFKGLDAERLIYALEDEKIYVSTGAACAASKGEKSHVLVAAGLDDETIAGSLRITFGADTTEEQIKTAAAKIAEIANKEWERINAR